MPWKKISKKDLKRKYKPWITDGILNKIKDKNRKYDKYVRAKEPERKESFVVEK